MKFKNFIMILTLVLLIAAMIFTINCAKNEKVEIVETKQQETSEFKEFEGEMPPPKPSDEDGNLMDMPPPGMEGEMPPENMNFEFGMTESSPNVNLEENNKENLKFKILIGIECFISATIIAYLIVSKFNKLSFEEATKGIKLVLCLGIVVILGIISMVAFTNMI